MQCLPLWVVKLCARLLIVISTQTPPQASIQTALVIKNADTSSVNSLAPLIQLLPPEVKDRLFCYSIQATVDDIDTLKNKIQYCMNMKTVDRAICDKLTPNAILDFCKIISASQPTNELLSIITPCPLPIAHEIMRRTRNINTIYSMQLVKDDPSCCRHTCLLQEAVINNNAKQVERLLALGANPNILNAHGNSIHDYVDPSQINIVKLLEGYKKNV